MLALALLGTCAVATALTIPPSSHTPVRFPLVKKRTTSDHLHELRESGGNQDTDGGSTLRRARRRANALLPIPWESAEYQGRESEHSYEYFTAVDVVAPNGNRATARSCCSTRARRWRDVGRARGPGFVTAG